ncbi:transposase [Sulfitobacter profundi]|uniref:Transposase n=1 Tax=Sulfitobacter profundi TaxID=2679961 RepID=A0ABW1YZQ1_9RHOB
MRDRVSPYGPNCYFFTLRLAKRDDDALLRHITALRQAMRETLARRPFRIDAIAVLPDVIHTVWTLPPNDNDYGNRIGMWKGRFSRHLPQPHIAACSRSNGGRRGYGSGVFGSIGYAITRISSGTAIWCTSARCMQDIVSDQRGGPTVPIPAPFLVRSRRRIGGRTIRRRRRSWTMM